MPATTHRTIIGILLPPLFLFFGAGISLNAQDVQPPAPEQQNRVAQPLRDRAVVFRIVTRVLEKDNNEAWNSDTYKVTIPGRPVGLKIVGENVAVSVQFTLYQHRNMGSILVAQGQIFTEMPGGGVQCRTIMQTLPFDFGEQVFFFPLGSGDPDYEALIEIQLEMSRYNETTANEDEGSTKETLPESRETVLN
jgi:hypothetical protein